MPTKKKKTAGQTDFGPSSKGVQEMFEKMRDCCMGEQGPINCSAMMDGMMKKKMEKCCGPRAENQTDNEPEKG
jgi:hypothetical protein